MILKANSREMKDAKKLVLRQKDLAKFRTIVFTNKKKAVAKRE